MSDYRARWSPLLIRISVLASGLCLAVGAVGIASLHKGRHHGWVALLALGLLAQAALMAVRGYRITPDAILVRRLLWSTRLPRAGLQGAVFEPGIMKGSLRTCGNGGLFSFTGWYRNQALGNFRALVTDMDRTVVLRYPGKTFVLSPDDPERFTGELAPPAPRS